MTFTKTKGHYDIHDASGKFVGYLGFYCGWFCVMFGVSEATKYPGMNLNQVKRAVRAA